MKQFWREVGLAVVLGMLMPGIILNIVTYSSHQRTNILYEPEQTDPVAEKEILIPVLYADGTVRQTELETYLLGVVLGEMPAEFEVEALKAQAVVARTYTLRAYEGKSKHDTFAVCTDPACCQAYRRVEDYLAAGGNTDSVEKIRSAVRATAGKVLTYGGELIEATYFSCSGGMTEDALAVWGTDVPYLQSVDSPGEEQAAWFTDNVTFTDTQLRELLGLPAQSGAVQFENLTFTNGGGVAELSVDGTRFKGTEIRKLLELRSTAFTVTREGSKVIFHTRGFGHRVGMSQYGADAMAVNGCVFTEILQHYYPGTVLENRFIDKPAFLG